MKNYNYCDKEIKSEAIKCRYCKKFLNKKSKKGLNTILNSTIEKTKSNIKLKKVDLSKSVFEVMEIGEKLHIDEIIQRIIDGLNNSKFYIKPQKENAQNRIGTIISYLTDKKSPQQKKIAIYFEQIGNNTFKMLGNINNEKIKKSEKVNNYNILEKVFFSFLIKPKFLNLENINKYGLGRGLIILYILIISIGFILLPIDETRNGRTREINYNFANKSNFEDFVIQFFIFYIVLTILMPLIYKIGKKGFLYIKNG